MNIKVFVKGFRNGYWLAGLDGNTFYQSISRGWASGVQEVKKLADRRSTY